MIPIVQQMIGHKTQSDPISILFLRVLCVLCLQPVMLRVQPVRVRPREIG
jgi:hypothetical protein